LGGQSGIENSAMRYVVQRIHSPSRDPILTYRLI
jgi:hypothetical protein